MEGRTAISGKIRFGPIWNDKEYESDKLQRRNELNWGGSLGGLEKTAVSARLEFTIFRFILWAEPLRYNVVGIWLWELPMVSALLSGIKLFWQILSWFFVFSTLLYCDNTFRSSRRSVLSQIQRKKLCPLWYLLSFSPSCVFNFASRRNLIRSNSS